MTRLHSDLRFAPVQVETEHRSDGSILLRSPCPLGSVQRCVGEWLERWAREAPERTFVAERPSTNASGVGDGWKRLSYREALDGARRIGGALLERGLGPERPLAILSDNGIDFALLSLGAMHAGIPVAPVSPAYSLMSRDHAKLKYIFELVRPGLVFASDPAKYAGALAALGVESPPLAELMSRPADDRLAQAYARVGPDTIAKILFTSGSTGTPKGVINTQRMLCSNQQSWAQLWPFVERRPPVLCEWLPWNHTFGGNATFNMVLRNGGSFYVDAGKPAPGLIETTVRNLKEIATTMHFNVPRGYDLLLPFLESDAALRATFFRDLDFVFYAAAALPQNLWQRIEKLALDERGGNLAMLSAWGSTETAPMSTCVHQVIESAGVVGVPAPGCEIKLAPSGSKLEARVRGPNVTPGYYRRADLTRASFDEEGFYRMCDAMKLADPLDARKGLVFDGRVAEDFKLSTGTWVSVGALRIRLIAAANPLIQDAVLTGHDRDEVGALLFVNPAAAKELDPAALRERIAQALAQLAAEPGGSASHPKRALVMGEPPSIDADEITDKGYINQRAVLEKRAALVERMYLEPPHPDVIRL